MMNKTELTKVLKENGATWNKKTVAYHMTKKEFDSATKNIEEVSVVKSKSDKNVLGLKINDTVVTKVIIDIPKQETKKDEEKSPKAKKETVKKNVEVGTHGHKAKGSSYIIVLKNKDDKKESQKTDLTTCAEVKAFLKTVSKKQLEYLRIYDENKNEVRKSAWVG